MVNPVADTHFASFLKLRTVRVLVEHKRSGGIERIENVEIRLDLMQFQHVQRLIASHRIAPIPDDDAGNTVDARRDFGGLNPSVSAYSAPFAPERFDKPFLGTGGDRDDALLRLRQDDWLFGDLRTELMICKNRFAELVSDRRTRNDIFGVQKLRQLAPAPALNTKPGEPYSAFDRVRAIRAAHVLTARSDSVPLRSRNSQSRCAASCAASVSTRPHFATAASISPRWQRDVPRSDSSAARRSAGVGMALRLCRDVRHHGGHRRDDRHGHRGRRRREHNHLAWRRQDRDSRHFAGGYG